jgi:hypothetical protein
MWYISFGGGSKGVNNILVYHENGKTIQPEVPAWQDVINWVKGNI